MTGPLLVFGQHGQLARELVRTGEAEGWAVVALGRTDADVTDVAAVENCVRAYRPAVIVNAAAYTAVDAAETDADAAFAINAAGPANLAAAAARSAVPLLHVSTDYVFDGGKDAAYTEDDPIRPLGVYGRSKASGEDRVRALCAEHVIVRTAWVYSAFGHNFVRTMVRLAGERDELTVVNDQVGNPTAGRDLARALITVAARVTGPGGGRAYGTYHFAGAGSASWYDFACAIVDSLYRRGAPTVPIVRPIASSDWPTTAPRPANSRLACEKIRAAFGVEQPSWRTSLEAVLDEIASADPKRVPGGP